MQEKRVIIIPEEKEKDCYDETFSSKVGHHQKIRVYCEENAIFLPLDENALGQVYAFQLAQYGCLVMNMEGEKAILYIPNQISENQKAWFEYYYSFLENYSISAFICENGKKILVEKNKETENPLVTVKSVMDTKIKKDAISYVRRIRY